MKVDAYQATPLKILDELGSPCPVFSITDEYVKNYEKISADHLSVFESDGVNPFMPEKFWGECEDITAGLVRKFTHEGGAVLDVGCGMGRLLDKLTAYRRYGMDISTAYLSYAVKVGAEVCLAKVEDMPYRDEFFDTVVCTDVLEHVIDLHAAVTQLFRVVKPGGHLVIRVPYRESLESYLRPGYPYHLAHLRNFDEYSLRMLFEKIFGGTLVDEVRGPYLEQAYNFKWPIKLKGLGFLVRTIFKLASFVSDSYKERLVRAFFNPIEISIAIRKPLSQSF